LKKYKGISGNNGITSYKILEKGIILEFQYKDLYLYDYIKPGKKTCGANENFSRRRKGVNNIRQSKRER
jgi:hypothetical protein